MNCTDNYTGIGEIPVCGDAVALPLLADATGTWSFISGFNSSYRHVLFAATAGLSIVVPIKLNEHYTYVFRLIRPDGTTLGDTAYTMRTLPMLPGNTYTLPVPGTLEAVRTGRLQSTATAEQTELYDLALKGAEQLTLFVEGAMQQEGPGVEQYLFDAVTGIITFNQPLVAGQRITIIYYK